MNKLLALCLIAALPVLAADGCMLQSESTSGMNKTCVYKCLSGEKSITIKATSLCPLTL